MIACVFGLMAVAAAEAGAARATVAAVEKGAALMFSVRVDLGRDVGQNFGSLFEARDARKRVVAGAGFMSAYNTRFRMDRHTLQFFVRPTAGADRFTLTRLPRPDDDCGLYMFDLDGKLYAMNDGAGRFFYEWTPSTSEWRRASGPVEGMTSSADGVVRLGSGLLRFLGGRVEYNGKTILSPPLVGGYSHFYYAQGRLFFYHTYQTDTGGFTRIYACPWTPQSRAPIDPERGDVLPLSPVGAVTWVFGQLGRQVLTVSNYGGVYAHDGRTWRVLRDPSPGVSYQVYSMANYYDRLLLGQYPTGEVFEFDGEALKQREGFPPRLPGVSASARECQTLAIYRGELFAGVWPWAEVWRYDRDADRWHSLGRLFTHPETTDKVQHPYEPESTRHGLVLNYWGQRVTSMVPIGNSLMLSTSAKGNVRWDGRFDFLSDTQRKEYGAVLQLTMSGSVAAPIHWKRGPTELQFLVLPDRLVIRQDGREIGSTPLDPELVRTLEPASVTWGNGVFGPLEGRITRKMLSLDGVVNGIVSAEKAP